MQAQLSGLFLKINIQEINMKNMLIVEDDILLQKVMRRNFKGDFEIDFCESTVEYYEKYSNKEYDIIIMDISLKGSGNGLELIKEIKAAPAFTGIPILCLTAHAQTKMRQTAIDSGSDLFITKPVTNRVLKDAIEFLLKSA
jgi:CheY-like chemotaxis protein